MIVEQGKNNNTTGAVLRLPTSEEMAKAGVHFGHRTTKWNPKMEPFIFGAKNNVHIIDLEKTKERLGAAVSFIKEVVKKGGVILLVGTNPAAKKVVETAAKKTQMPYVAERWLGGTLTNFKIISKRLDYFRELEKKRNSGELKKYTKKEQHDFDEELKKLERKFGGIKNLTKLPDAIFVVDPQKNNIAIREAIVSKVKVISLCDTNIDPTGIDYPIPSSDDAITAIELITNTVILAIKEGKDEIKSEAKNPQPEAN